MTEFLLNAHSGWQYVALAAVVVSVVLSFQSTMTPTIEKVYRATAIAVDIQVALGLFLWFSVSGWNLGLMQGWVHPIFGLVALGILHAFVGRARKADPTEANKTVRTGLIIAAVLVVAAIGISEMA